MPTPSEQLLSRTIYDVDGTTTVWNFSFTGGYLDPSHVKAYTELPTGVRTPIVVTPEMLIGEFQLQISPALPPSAGVLVIYRDTPKDLPLVDFVEGPLSEIALDTNAKQAVFIAAEAQDTINTYNLQAAAWASETVSVKNFGAVGDGIADDGAAIKLALAYGCANGVGVDFGSGTYFWDTRSTNSGSFVVTDSLRIFSNSGARIIRREVLGEGARSIIERVFTDESQIKIPYFECDGISFEGQFDTTLNEIPTTTYINISSFDRVVVNNCKFKNIAKLTFSVFNCNTVQYTGNSWFNCARDGARAIGCKKVVVSGNTFERVFDDCVAVTTAGAFSGNLETQVVCNGNTVTDSQGFYFGGGHRISVTGNTFVRPQLRIISLNMSGVQEGDHGVFAVNISGNTIIDPMARPWLGSGNVFGWQTSFNESMITMAIEVRGPETLQPGAALDGVVSGGVVLQPYGNYYTNNQTLSTGIVPKTSSIVISGNVVKRTLRSDGVMFSTYGLGLPPTKYGAEQTDLLVTEGTHRVAGVSLSGYLKDVSVRGNIFEGVDFGIQYNDLSRTLDTLIVENNTFFDIRRACVGTYVSGEISTAKIKEIIVDGNNANCDPYYIARNSTGLSARTADGGFNTTRVLDDLGLVRGFVVVPVAPDFCRVTNNTVKNCGSFVLNSSLTTGSRIPLGSLVEQNTIWVGTATTQDGVGFGALKLGVAQLPAMKANRAVYYDSDIASSGFGDVQSTTLYQSGVMPTTGFYLRGHVVLQTNESSSSAYLWFRATTGTSHVLGTDWIAVS